MRRTDDGYALVAAVAAVAVFGLVAFQVLASNQGDIAELRGESEHARLMADADAGVALAVHGLAEAGTDTAWPIDGSPRQVAFAGSDLTIRVEDERGKVSLQGLNDAEVRTLFGIAGASGDRLDALVGEFERWTNTDSDPARDRADARPGLAPRHGPLRTVGELGGLRDMDAALYARLAPVTTTFFENSGGFEEANASPEAITVVHAGAADALGNADQRPDIEGRKPVEQIDRDSNLIGRTLTVRVTARAADGATAHRTAIVELTGDPATPVWTRFSQ